MEFVPGYVCGLTRVTIAYPFEFIKTNMQKDTKITINDIKKNPLIVYRGASYNYFSVPIDRSIQFYLAETFKDKYNPYLTGLFSGSLSCIYNVPISYFCTNKILGNKFDYRKVYNGFRIELARSMMGSSIYMGTYIGIRERYKTENIWLNALYGCFAGCFTWTFTYPLDTIRVDAQTTNFKYKEIIKTRYASGGIKKFYSGISMVCLRSLPASFTGIYMYELTRKTIIT